MKRPFCLTSDCYKKSPITNKEKNREEFCKIAFNAITKCPKVSLAISDISSIIKTLYPGIYFSRYEEFHHLAFYTLRTDLTGR